MKLLKKLLLSLPFAVVFLTTITSAGNYLYFYGDGCPHCAVVKRYFDNNGIEKKYDVEKKEVWFDKENNEMFLDLVQKLGVDLSEVGVPYMIYEINGELTGAMGDKSIIKVFQTLEESGKDAVLSSGAVLNQLTELTSDQNPIESEKSRWGFLAILMPAALADSINPCAFAVMLLLLSTILTKSKSRKKAMLAGILFSLAVFMTYFLLGLGVFKVLAFANVSQWIMLGAGILGLLIGIFNIVDYLRPKDAGPIMEVPMSWRPMMMGFIEKLVSPWGAFAIGIIVSLFLLPCSSGPYLTVLGFLHAEDQTLNNWGYFYLFIYNFIFILPMLFITFLIGFGVSSVDKLAKIKNENTKQIHLVVGILMLGLGGYLLGQYFGWR